jgi:hypothetical protein
MNYALDFGGEPQDLTMTLTGELDVPGLRAFIQDLIVHADYREGLLILVDISGLDASSFGEEEYESVRDAIAGRDFRYPAKAIAIVAPDAGAFDLAKRHRAYVGGSKSGREVFSSRADATAWLAGQRRLQ